MPRPPSLLAPSPQPAHLCADGDVAAAARRLDCRTYDRCLALAARRGWRGFHCRACRAYAPLPSHAQHRDLLGLLALVVEGGLGPAAVGTPPPPPPTHQGVFLPDVDDTVPQPVVAAPPTRSPK
jgi:hypothetical protein